MADRKIKLVFQGDSITDAGRDKRNYHDVGPGYPKYASEILVANHPEIDFEFINFGISGNRTDQLFDRLVKDGIHIDIHIDGVSRELIDKAHQNGLTVNCWTVNEKELAEKFISWGIDFITTNILE